MGGSSMKNGNDGVFSRNGHRFLEAFRTLAAAILAASSLGDMQGIGKLTTIDTGASFSWFVVNSRGHDDLCLIFG
jgi:hypothetical protein